MDDQARRVATNQLIKYDSGQRRCSFCGKLECDVFLMMHNEAEDCFICDECVAKCVEFIKECKQKAFDTTRENVIIMCEAMLAAEWPNLKEKGFLESIKVMAECSPRFMMTEKQEEWLHGLWIRHNR